MKNNAKLENDNYFFCFAHFVKEAKRKYPIRRDSNETQPQHKKEAYLDEIFLVVFIKDFEHVGPEWFLPFEHCLLGDNIWCNVSLQTTLKEQMCQWFNVVIGIVIDDHCILAIGQITLVDHKRWATIFWQIGREQRSLSNLIPSSTIFSSDSVTFEKYWSLVTW